MIRTAQYPLLQAYTTQDRIRDLLEVGYRMIDRHKYVEARDAFLAARERVNRTTGNKNVARMINSELKAMRVLACRQENDRLDNAF